MRKILVSILILVTMLIMPLNADTPITGMKQYNYQYDITNTADYPDYLFLTSSEIWNFEYPSLIVNGTFGGGYKLDGFILHAIKKEDMSQTVKEELTSSDHDKKNLSPYFESAPLATSEILLPVSTSLSDKIPLTNLTVQLQVTGISDRILNITKIKTIYHYVNGTSSEEMDQEPSLQNSTVTSDLNQLFSPDSLLEKI